MVRTGTILVVTFAVIYSHQNFKNPDNSERRIIWSRLFFRLERELESIYTIHLSINNG